MKKHHLILFVSFIFLSTNGYNQELNWSQTVKYIKNIAEFHGKGNPSKTYSINIDELGNISEKYYSYYSETKSVTEKFNIKDIDSDSIYIVEHLISGERHRYDVILKCKNKAKCASYETYPDKYFKFNEWSFSVIDNKTDAEKLLKALKHLKKLSNNIKDPFG